MDTSQERYRKIITTYKLPMTNIISQYPISTSELPTCRNLKYLVQKQQLLSNYPYSDPLYQQTIQDIKHMLQQKNIQTQILSVRLARVLPFIHRIKMLQLCQNELGKLLVPIQQIDSKHKDNENSSLLYQVNVDLVQLLLSIYQITYHSDDIYFDINQKIITLFTRLTQQIYGTDKNLVRNAYEVLRFLFMVFGEKQINKSNKLIDKVINSMIYSTSFVAIQQNQQGPISTNRKFRMIILRCRQYQARVRSRLLLGLCFLLTYINDLDTQIHQLLLEQILIIAQNVNECDVHLDCFTGIRVLLNIPLQFYLRNEIVRRWYAILSQVSFKKQYWQHFISLTRQVRYCPVRLKYHINIGLLEITRNIQQQFSRFMFYKQSCRNLMEVSRLSPNKQSNILLNIFLHGWFVDRIKQQNDLFRSQFLICILHSYFSSSSNSQPQQIHDLLGLCHCLLDWKCSCKQQTHIPTIKFAFDIYLKFLQKAGQLNLPKIGVIISQLIERCNDQNTYFLFKLKLISTIIQLPWYKVNWSFAQCKLNLDFLEGQIRPFMMPKNPKPIFDYEYSLTEDGQIESRKQIDYIKVIIGLLASLPKIHDIETRVSIIVVDYQTYLNDLQAINTSNKQLINCLLTLQADNFFTDCQRNFLLALIDSIDFKGNNSQLSLSGNIVYSPYEMFYCQEDINIFGTMSPVQLTLRILQHPSISSVYLQIRKNQWVAMPPLKLVVSSGIQKKQVPFESCILQIKVDKIGALHFEVWTVQGAQLLIGSGQFKLRRKLKWRKVNHLNFIDGIRTKAYFKNAKIEDGTYLTYYFGQPVMVQVLTATNQIVVTLSSREIWNQMQQAVAEMIQELTQGNPEFI